MRRTGTKPCKVSFTDSSGTWSRGIRGLAQDRSTSTDRGDPGADLRCVRAGHRIRGRASAVRAFQCQPPSQSGRHRPAAASRDHLLEGVSARLCREHPRSRTEQCARGAEGAARQVLSIAASHASPGSRPSARPALAARQRLRRSERPPRLLWSAPSAAAAPRAPDHVSDRFDVRRCESIGDLRRFRSTSAQ
jgi:hypothetical protein